MLLSAVSFLVFAQSSSEVPEGLLNSPVVFLPINIYRRPDDCPQLEPKHIAVNKTDKQ